jgi:glutamine cyclotransferase
MVNGKLFINIFLSPKILIVDPETGHLFEELDFS